MRSRGKARTASDGTAARGWDQDRPAARKWTPPGIPMPASRALALPFGSKVTSDV